MSVARLAVDASFSGTGEGSDDSHLVNCLFMHPSELVADGVLNYAKSLRRVDTFSLTPLPNKQHLARFRAPVGQAKTLVTFLGHFSRFAEEWPATFLTVNIGFRESGFEFGPLKGIERARALALIKESPEEAARLYGPIKRDEVRLFTSEERCYGPIFDDNGAITLGFAPAKLYPYPEALAEIRPLVAPSRPRILVTPFIVPNALTPDNHP